MYKITLTGSTGFIGGHLMKFLGTLGYEVDTISKDEFMNEDFKRVRDFGLLGKGPTDIVVHCAWIREQDLHKTDHLEFAELSCHFFEECKKAGVRVVNIGSSSEYGVKDKAMKEDMICEPINTYGIAKLAVTLFAKKLGFNTLRLFTVTGEGGHSFKDIYDKVEKWSSPCFTRDYISVEKVCLSVERLMHATHLHGEIINIGSGLGRSHAESFYVDHDPVACNSHPCKYDELWYKYPQRQYEPRRWYANTDKMGELLNI